MGIKKIVKCLPEQYLELLEKGQVEVNGEIKTKEEDTLYDVGELAINKWFNKFMEAQYEKVRVLHTPVAMKSLEQEYNELTNEEGRDEDSDLPTNVLSAIGYTAILRNGDTVVVGAPNVGVFYINGAKVTNNYTYTGDGYEVVNVWCFQDDGAVAPELNDKPTFNITELDVRNMATTPVVGNNYKNNTLIIKSYNLNVCGSVTKKLTANGSETFNLNTNNAFTLLEEVESDCVTFPGSGATSPLNGKTNLKKVIFPNLTTIQAGNSSGGTSFLSGCTNTELEIYFPKLKTINSFTGATKAGGAFGNVKNVTLPPNVTYVGSYNMYGNQTITLECNKASFHTNWCSTTPTVNFTMYDDWKASINIAVAAKNHTIDWFVDLFENKLATVEAGSKEISIPIAIYDAMSDTEDCPIDIAEVKGWIVGGI